MLELLVQIASLCSSAVVIVVGLVLFFGWLNQDQTIKSGSDHDEEDWEDSKNE